MAQSLGRKIKRGKVIPYINGQGKVDFMHLKKHYRYFCFNFSKTNYDNRIDQNDLLICNLKPITSK